MTVSQEVGTAQKRLRQELFPSADDAETARIAGNHRFVKLSG
jgi:hypothetical protein